MAHNGIHKVLAQARPSGTSLASIYSPPSDKKAKISAIIIANTTGSAATFKLCLDEDGTTYSEATALYWSESVPANSTWDLFLDGDSMIPMIDPAGNIAFAQGTSEALTITLLGFELVDGSR